MIDFERRPIRWSKLIAEDRAHRRVNVVMTVFSLFVMLSYLVGATWLAWRLFTNK